MNRRTGWSRGALVGAIGGATLSLGLLMACSGPQSTPEGTVRSFLDALEARDSARFADSFTDETRSLVAEIETLSRSAEGPTGKALTIGEWCTAFCGGEIDGSTLHGDSATVRVRLDQSVDQIPLRRVGDRWKIDLSEKLLPAVQMLRLATSGADTVPGR